VGAHVSSLREEVERGWKKGLSDARRFSEGAGGMEQWGGGPCAHHASRGEGGLVGATGLKPTEAGGSGRQRSKAGGHGRRMDRGGGGENGSPTCGHGGHSATQFNRSSDSNRNSNDFK
jgi:hypothetical protein